MKPDDERCGSVPHAAVLQTRGSNSGSSHTKSYKGVSNSWESGIGRSLGPGQTLVHLLSNRDTYWGAAHTSAIPLSGTLVTINDTAPTTHRCNLLIRY